MSYLAWITTFSYKNSKSCKTNGLNFSIDNKPSRKARPKRKSLFYLKRIKWKLIFRWKEDLSFFRNSLEGLQTFESLDLIKTIELLASSMNWALNDSWNKIERFQQELKDLQKKLNSDEGLDRFVVKFQPLKKKKKSIKCSA